jgi:hypothetical protein
MRRVEFERLLDPDNRLRVRFDSERGHILRFTVQLECCFEPGHPWVPVVRYDSAHGFAHCDRLHPYRPSAKTTMRVRDLNEALNLAIEDLAQNWSKYRRRYEAWLRQE